MVCYFEVFEVIESEAEDKKTALDNFKRTRKLRRDRRHYQVDSAHAKHPEQFCSGCGGQRRTAYEDMFPRSSE